MFFGNFSVAKKQQKQSKRRLFVNEINVEMQDTDQGNKTNPLI